MNKAGCDYSEIPDRKFKTIATQNADRIISGLEKSNIIFSAKYDEDKITLTYSQSDEKKINQIIRKKDSDIDSFLELNENQREKSLERFLPEISVLLNTSVSSLESRPKDLQLMLIQIYINNYYADDIAIKKALQSALDLNAVTKTEIEQAEKEIIPKQSKPEKETRNQYLHDLNQSMNTNENSAAETERAYIKIATLNRINERVTGKDSKEREIINETIREK